MVGSSSCRKLRTAYQQTLPMIPGISPVRQSLFGDPRSTDSSSTIDRRERIRNAIYLTGETN